jgi:hypothetical protein
MESKDTALTVADSQTALTVVATNALLDAVGSGIKLLSDIDNMTAGQSLLVHYLETDPRSPDAIKAGATINCVPVGLQHRIMRRISPSGEEEEQEVLAFRFLVNGENGEPKLMENSSTQLTGVISSMFSEGTIRPGLTPIRIIFLGYFKNKNNPNSSARFDVRLLASPAK